MLFGAPLAHSTICIPNSTRSKLFGLKEKVGPQGQQCECYSQKVKVNVVLGIITEVQILFPNTGIPKNGKEILKEKILKKSTTSVF